MKITVLYNTNTSTADDPLLKIADDDTIKTATAVSNALKSFGHEVDTFDITEKTFKEILFIDADLYFNCSEGIGNIPKSFADVARELEKIDIPFTGSSSKSLLLTTNKAKVKEILLKKGIGTANYKLFDGDYSKLVDLKYPLIIKPSSEDCSIGIDENSVVKNLNELKNKIEKLDGKYDEQLLIEEYIDGREFAITVMGNGKDARVLPLYEVHYDDYFNGKHKIYDYRTKWDNSYEMFSHIVEKCPANVSEEIAQSIKETALSTFFATKCSDYARVDMRLSSDGKPYVLEINANPGIGPLDAAIISAKAEGTSYEEFLQNIINFSLKRFYDNSQEKYSPLFNASYA